MFSNIFVYIFRLTAILNFSIIVHIFRSFLMIINVHEMIKESFVDRLTSLFPKTKVEYFVESIEIEGSDKLTDMIEKFYPAIADEELFKNLSYTNLLGKRVKHQTFFENLSVKLLFYVDNALVTFHVTEDKQKLYITDQKLMKLKIELIDGVVKNEDKEIINCQPDDVLTLFALSFYGEHIGEWFKSVGKKKPKSFKQSDVDNLLTFKDEIIDYILIQEMVIA